MKLSHIRTNHPILEKGCNLIANGAKEEIIGNYPTHRAGSFICLSDEKSERLHLFVLETKKKRLREEKRTDQKNTQLFAENCRY